MSQKTCGSAHCRVLMLAMALLVAAGAWAGAEPEKSDIRVLIDISGSMRQNDPGNLRRPALRMLAGLLQPGTRAGVWTFARWVNNLVPVAEVDAAWKKRTQSLSKQIASPGQFTNIEEVIDRASRDWSGRPSTHARHLVLLTDGMVDVSKNTGDNAASRARILDKLLPRLKDTGVKVHTIALSERADHALMKRLAGETGGWYQQVEQADQLQRVFLKMFETVGKPDAVPLQDNRFTVDGSIHEATVLVFSKPGAQPVVLHAPSGEQYTDSDLPAGVAWYRDTGYDLITIASPQKGEWRLQADVDPDNRVMIVTDLKLRTSEVPAHLATGEQVRVEAHLSNQGKLVDRQAFLRLLELRGEANTVDGTDPLGLNDAGDAGDDQAGDGRYAMQFVEHRARDTVELLVAVDSPTFMREKRFRLAVHEPGEGRVVEGPQGPVFELQSSIAVLQPGATVEVWQQRADSSRQPLVATDAGEGRWTAPLAESTLPVYAKISGTSRLGNLITHDVGPLLAPGVEPPPVAEPPPVVEAAPAEAVAEPSAEPSPEPVVQPPAVPEETPPLADLDAESDVEEGGWVMPAMLFGGFNILLLIGGGAWWFLRRRRANDADEDDVDIDALVGDSSGEAGDGQSPSQEEAA